LAYAARLLKEYRLPYKKLLKSFALEEFQNVLFSDKTKNIVKTVFKIV